MTKEFSDGRVRYRDPGRTGSIVRGAFGGLMIAGGASSWVAGGVLGGVIPGALEFALATILVGFGTLAAAWGIVQAIWPPQVVFDSMCKVVRFRAFGITGLRTRFYGYDEVVAEMGVRKPGSGGAKGSRYLFVVRARGAAMAFAGHPRKSKFVEEVAGEFEDSAGMGVVWSDELGGAGARARARSEREQRKRERAEAERIRRELASAEPVVREIPMTEVVVEDVDVSAAA